MYCTDTILGYRAKLWHTYGELPYEESVVCVQKVKSCVVNNTIFWCSGHVGAPRLEAFPELTKRLKVATYSKICIGFMFNEGSSSS